jgi:hypothetical protein
MPGRTTKMLQHRPMNRRVPKCEPKKSDPVDR